MLTICTHYIAFVAAAGFLFGQIFTGYFSIAATLAGTAGLACASGSYLLSANPLRYIPWVPWAGLLTLTGVAFDAAHYYSHLAIQGNYYPWFMVLPYAGCVVWVGHTAYKRRTNKVP